MTNIHIPTDTHLISIKFGTEELLAPAIAIRGDFSDLDLPESRWSNGKLLFSFFSIVKIEKITSNGSTRCRVYFYPTDTQVQYSFDIEIQYLAVLISLHNIPSTIMSGLNLYFIDKKKHATRVKEAMPLTSFDFAVSLPPLGTDDYNEIQDQLDVILPENFSTPLANIAWDEIIGDQQQNKIPESVLFAQSQLFNLLMGLTHDNPNVIVDLLELETLIEILIDYNSVADFDVESEFEYDDEEDLERETLEYSPLAEESEQLSMVSSSNTASDSLNNADYDSDEAFNEELERRENMESLNEKILAGNYIVQILDSAIQRLFASNPANLPDGNIDVIPNDNVSVYTSEIFNEIIKGSYEQTELEETKEKYKLKIVDEKRSEAIKVWNESLDLFMKREMPQVYSTLVEYNLYDELIDILKDPTEEELENEDLNELTTRSITLKIVLLATFILKKVKCIEIQENINISSTLLLVKILNPHRDTNIWELPALADTLLNYHIQYAVDVMTMHYDLTRDEDDLQSLFVALHSIGHHLIDDDHLKKISQEEFAQALDGIENNTTEFNEFCQWIMDYRGLLLEALEEYDDELNDDDYDEGCPVSDAINTMINGDDNEEDEDSEEHGLDIPALAKMIAYSYPAFSDIECNISGLEPTHPLWNTTRRIFIQRLLDGFTENYGQRKADVDLR